MAVTGTNITLVLRAEKGSILEEDELDGNQSELKDAIENHGHDEFAAALGADDNYMTDAEKTKLAGIAAGAEVNVQADWDASTGDAAILNKPSIPSISGLLNEAAHDALDHTGLTGVPAAYSLPTASTTVLGGVKVDGTTVTISDGVISATGGSGMTNPMTAAGDIIIGGTSGAPTRLAKGADGQLLGYVGGTLVPVDQPSGGASSSLIAEYIVGSGTSSGTTHYVGGGSAVSSINISDLDGNTHGDYTVEAVFALATAGELHIAINGDETVANYSYYANDFAAAWSNSADGPRLNWCYDGCRDTLEIDRLPNGKTMITVITGDNNTTPHITVSAVVHNSVVSNITSLGFKPGAVGNTISVGSQFKIYRRR